MVTAHHWWSGEKKPGNAKRLLLLERFAIAPKLWDEAAKPRRVAPPSPAESPEEVDANAAILGGPYAIARTLEVQLRQLLTRLSAAPIDTDGELKRAQTMASAAATLERLTKITGEHDLGRKVMKLPMFSRAVTEIAKALRPWPEAAAAVAKRLEELEDGQANNRT